MDIGAVIKGPFEDQDWLKKLLLVGVVNVLICCTVIGIFVGVPNLMGWGKAYAKERASGGTTLPEFGFGYIGDGYRVIGGMIIFGLIAAVGAIPFILITAVLGKIAGPLALIGVLLMIGYYIVLAPVSGIIVGRIYLDDDMMAGTGIVSAIMQAKDNIGASAMFLVTMIVLGLVSMVMGFVPIIGGMFGAAFQGAAGALAIVQFRQALGNR
jgi:hypothetical protein